MSVIVYTISLALHSLQVIYHGGWASVQSFKTCLCTLQDVARALARHWELQAALPNAETRHYPPKMVSFGVERVLGCLHGQEMISSSVSLCAERALSVSRDAL